MEPEITAGEEPQSAPPLPLVPSLRIVFSGETGICDDCVFALRFGRTRIGRQAEHDSDIVLPADRRVSRLHARLEVEADDRLVLLHDEHSSHGTFVNGQRVESAELHSGDVIRVGDSYLIYRCDPPDQAGSALPELLGLSPAMQRLRGLITKVASTRTPVLIQGESGTGKEIVAQSIHRMSGRTGAFLPINCAALPAELAESLLFGHLGRVFSGASAKAQSGYFQAAEHGTLFLDEIGDMPLALQPKLLRALATGTVLPVGATRAVVHDVRIVAATNRPLGDAIAEGKFRADLFARLAGVEIHLPPLRERREDVLPLLASVLAPSKKRLSPGLVHELLLHDWPLNAREVIRLGEQLRLFGSEATILGYHLVTHLLPRRSAVLSTQSPAAATIAAASLDPLPPRTFSAAALAAEPPTQLLPDRQVLVATLQQQSGIVTRAAKTLGCTRWQLYRLIERYQIDLEAMRPST